LKTDAPHVKQLVLIGGGHTHALLVKRLCMHPIAGLRVVLISNVIETPYSGMLPGLIAGIYTREQTHIDVARLAEMAGATFILDRAAGIDKSTRLVHLNEHPPIHFDLLSIDVGITPQMEHVDGARQHSTPIKPVPEFLSMWQKVCEQSRHKAIRIMLSPCASHWEIQPSSISLTPTTSYLTVTVHEQPRSCCVSFIVTTLTFISTHA